LPGAKNLPSPPMMMPAMITPMMSTGDPFHRLGTALFLGIAGVPVRPRARFSMGIIAQLRFADSCSGSAVPSGRGRHTAFPVPSCDQGPHGPAGHGKPIQACNQSTTCLQSQIRRDRDLERWGPALLTGAMVVSVGVRWGPLVTAVNGTLVARPVLASLIQSPRTEESGHAAALLILL
jgi:hypothetical protein